MEKKNKKIIEFLDSLSFLNKNLSSQEKTVYKTFHTLDDIQVGKEAYIFEIEDFQKRHPEFKWYQCINPVAKDGSKLEIHGDIESWTIHLVSKEITIVFLCIGYGGNQHWLFKCLYRTQNSRTRGFFHITQYDSSYSLSIALFQAYQTIDERYFDDKKDLAKSAPLACDEIEDILKRIDKIKDKLDASPDYSGSMRFDDAGAWEDFTKKAVDFRKEIFALAGDLSKEELENGEVFSYEEHKQWRLALNKLRKEDKIDKVIEIKNKYLNQ